MQAGIWQNEELLALVAFVLSVVIVVFYLVHKLYAYIKKPALEVPLTRSQKCFYGSLCQLSAKRAIVLNDISLTQFTGFRFQCSKWSASYRKLKAQKFDFVLCRRNDFSSIAVIEFEGDKSRNKISADIEKICRSKSIAVYRVSASSVVKLDELDELLFPDDSARFVRSESGFQVPIRYAEKEAKALSD